MKLYYPIPHTQYSPLSTLSCCRHSHDSDCATKDCDPDDDDYDDELASEEVMGMKMMGMMMGMNRMAMRMSLMVALLVKMSMLCLM
jgi:hypothetical protein